MFYVHLKRTHVCPTVLGVLCQGKQVASVVQTFYIVTGLLTTCPISYGWGGLLTVIVGLLLLEVQSGFALCILNICHQMHKHSGFLCPLDEVTPLSLRNCLFKIPGNILCSEIYSNINMATPPFFYQGSQCVAFPILLLLLLTPFVSLYFKRIYEKHHAVGSSLLMQADSLGMYLDHFHVTRLLISFV